VFRQECLRDHSTIASCTVTVDSTDLRAGKSAVERIFEALGALAERFDDFTAFVTVFDQGPAGTAVMAAELLAAGVYSKS